MRRTLPALFVMILTVAAPAEAFALIMGGEGNKPIDDPGWPKGAAAIFNHPGRVAWWEGPPFGGGHWHSECRGDAKALTAVLADFARLDVKVKRVFVHDGRGRSFWLAANKEPGIQAAANVDWAFNVWQASRWEQLRNLPVDLNPTDPGDDSPTSYIDVYTGGLPWSDVTVPKGVEVVDQRLIARGFTLADGIVLEGKVADLSTKLPITATIRIQRVEPLEKGGYSYPLVTMIKADSRGRWVFKHAPKEWLRVVVEAEGFAPRVAAYARFDDEPRWQSYETGLSRRAAVSGRVVDEAGMPLADVDVRFDDVSPPSGGRYESAIKDVIKTDSEGRFRAETLPAGKATVWVHKPGYCRPGTGLKISMPSDAVEIKMMKSANLKVFMNFTGKQRPAGYSVKIAPEGGEVVGSYGGTGNIDEINRIAFENLPPGRYILLGRPNPGADREQTEPVVVELKGGQDVEVTLKAK